MKPTVTIRVIYRNGTEEARQQFETPSDINFSEFVLKTLPEGKQWETSNSIWYKWNATDKDNYPISYGSIIIEGRLTGRPTIEHLKDWHSN